MGELLNRNSDYFELILKDSIEACCSLLQPDFPLYSYKHFSIDRTIESSLRRRRN